MPTRKENEPVRRFSPRYWRRMARLLALGLALAALLSLIGVAGMGLHWVESLLHPPRQPVERTPTSVGIEEYETVALRTADGLTLYGWYIPSRNGAAVILGHGLGANRAAMLPQAQILAQAGFGLLLFDWRNHGESEGEGPLTFGLEEEQDMAAALDFVAGRPEVDPQRIGALGVSMGSVIVLRSAAHDLRVRALVLDSAFASLEEEARHLIGGYPLVGPLLLPWARWRSGIDPAAVQPLDDVARISPRPLLLIYGTEDEVVSPGSGEALFAAAGEPKEIWWVEGAGHLPVRADTQGYRRRVVDFFRAALLDR